MATTTATSAQTGTKRKQSAAGIATSGRNVKRRASKACHCCRSRKVRCDVVESGIPCTNCRLDEVECLVTEGKRRRKSYVDGDLLHHSPSASAQDDKEIPLFPMLDELDDLNDLALPLDAMSAGATLHTLDDSMAQHRPHMLYQTQGHRLSNEERNRRMSTISMSARLPTYNSPPAMTGMAQGFQLPSKGSDDLLPLYVRAVGPNVMGEDLNYLQRIGAFNLPETGLRNELLRCYVQYVHPNLPLLDLNEFLSAIHKNDGTETVSLLLFQSVMFAGTGFIDMRYLVAQGYDTRKAARRAYFQKCKALFDFDYELDRSIIVQAVLLMTYWYEAPDDPKDIWHWLGIAISTARTIGMNCDTSGTASMTPKTRNLWKRVWWCCFMRDRLISLGMRRPLRISEDESDLPMLQLEDFETEALSLELSRMLGGCPVVRDESKRVTLAKMCIALCKLCMIISPIFALQYSLGAAKLGLTQETTLRLGPKSTAADAGEVTRLDDKLSNWFSDQDTDLHYFIPETQDRTNTNDGEVIGLHRALLSGVYLTLVSALHRPQILPTVPTTFISPDLQDLSRRKMRSAADDITEIYKDLYASDMIRYLPNTGVSVLLPAIIVHMLDLKSTDQNVKQASSRKFQFCMQALQRLREMYASADFAFSFLDAAVRRADVNVPQGPPKLNTDNKQQNQHSTPMLTPPPEATWTAHKILFASTISAEERRLFSAFTPPKSDSSLHSVMTGGAAIALTDLPMSDNGDSADSQESAEEAEARQMEEQALHDFDTLINLEGGNDTDSMFQEDNQRNEIYAAMNDAWLNGMSDDHDSKKKAAAQQHFALPTITNVLDDDDDHGHDMKSSEVYALMNAETNAYEHHDVTDHMGGYGYQEVKVTGDLDADLDGWS